MPKAVIMAGGQGERFWPLTHAEFPKYRIRFYGKQSLLQKTYERLKKVYGAGNIYVITTEHHAKMIREELRALPKAHILIEPFRNNTAAAIYLSCAILEKKFGPGEVVSFFPADHVIRDEKLFKKTIETAIRTAKKSGDIVTVGVVPTFPATGYGYIETGRPVRGLPGSWHVKRFVEKPDLKKAQSYVRRENFYWNGGIFTWRIEVFMAAMKKHSPAYGRTLDLSDLERSYKKLPNTSIDYALMEKAKNIVLCRAAMDWCDVGSWDMYLEKSGPDAEGCYSEGLLKTKETKNSLFVNHSQVPLVALGVSNLIVVQTPRGTLVCSRRRSEEAALLFKQL